MADHHLAELAHLVASTPDTKGKLEPVLAEQQLARAPARSLCWTFTRRRSSPPAICENHYPEWKIAGLPVEV